MLAPDRDRDDIADQPVADRDRFHHSRELSGAVRDLDAIGAIEHRPTGTLTATFGAFEMEFRQLLPEPATVHIEPLLASITNGLQLPAERPYTLVNFISSVDGRATLKGRSGGLGDDGDRAMFHGLREQVDAVLAGTGTLRTERYGRILGKPERPERRLAAGLSAEPLACIISRSGELPTDIPLFAEPEARIIVFAPAEPDLSNAAAQVEVVLV